MSLQGQVVYVAGGSGIIGSCAVLACLQNGAKVWTSSRNESKFDEYKNSFPEELRSNLFIRKADLNNEEDCVKICEEIVSVCGKINHVLSAIGGWIEEGKLSEVSLDVFKNAMRERSLSHLIVYRTFAKYLSQTPGSTYTFINGGSVDDEIATMLPPCASTMVTSASLVHGLYQAGVSEFKNNENLAVLQLRIYFMIGRELDSTYNNKSNGAGSDYIGRFIVKMMKNHKKHTLYKLKSRENAEEYLKSM